MGRTCLSLSRWPVARLQRRGVAFTLVGMWTSQAQSQVGWHGFLLAVERPLNPGRLAHRAEFGGFIWLVEITTWRG
jgi:hypothetical protein